LYTCGSVLISYGGDKKKEPFNHTLDHCIKSIVWILKVIKG